MTDTPIPDPSDSFGACDRSGAQSMKRVGAFWPIDVTITYG